MSISIDRIKEVLSASAYKDFSKFMQGQTGELVGGVMYIYEDDFIRWILKKPVVD